MSHYLFVYGTLQAGHAPPEIAHAVEGFRHVGKGSITGTLYHLGEFPGAIISSEASGKISGEVVELPADPNVIAHLDDYEGFYPDAPDESLFVRISQPVLLDSGETLRCWIYVYNRDPGSAPVVPDGRFVQK